MAQPPITIARSFVEVIALPYVSRELPGWGKVFATLVGGYQRDWFWEGAGDRIVRGKLHGYQMTLDMSRWTDRLAFFLRRWYDLETQLLLRAVVKPGDTVVDVGANRGMFALISSSAVGPTGKVICFEPNPRCVAVLESDVKRNQILNIDVRAMALGVNPETLTLSIPRINTGEATLGTSKYADDEKIECLVRNGDSELSGTKPRLIKIDAEGFECSVLGGLTNTLDQVRPLILTEVAAEHLKRCGSSPQSLYQLMANHNYVGYRLILDGARSGGVRFVAIDPGREEFDALWIPREGVDGYLSYIR